jgi:hypothetical protein
MKLGKLIAAAAAIASIAVTGCMGNGDTEPAAPRTGRGHAPSIDCVTRELPFSRGVDLTGIWTDDIGAMVYVRHVGKAIWWTAMSGAGGPESDLGKGFAPVARGRLGSRLRIRAQWADVPRGRELNWGTIVFEVVKTRIGGTQIREFGDTEYDGNVWTPCAPQRAPGNGTGPQIRCNPRAFRFSPGADLTGTWVGDDGGLYYLRQIGDALWWLGMSGVGGPERDLGTGFTNVVRGRFRSPTAIEADWADVPRGGKLNSGTLTLTVTQTNTGGAAIRRAAAAPVGSFSASEWRPCTPSG